MHCNRTALLSIAMLAACFLVYTASFRAWYTTYSSPNCRLLTRGGQTDVQYSPLLSTTPVQNHRPHAAK